MTELAAGLANIMISLQVLPKGIPQGPCSNSLWHVISMDNTLCWNALYLDHTIVGNNLWLATLHLHYVHVHHACKTTVLVMTMSFLQCQGSLVQWMLAIVLSLWSPDDQASLKQQPDGVTSIYTNASDTVRQITPLYSMMRHVGTAMLQTRTDCPKAAMQMTQLISGVTNSGHW
jgi:hypothetical protein